MKRILSTWLMIYMLSGVAIAQTGTTASSGGTGWKRIAVVKGNGGRGFGRVSLYTTGGSIEPIMFTVDWFHGWAGNIGLSASSNSLSSRYWSAARMTDDGTNSYIEINFTADVPLLNLLSDNYGWQVAEPYSGVLPDGGGTVWSTVNAARFNVGGNLTVSYNGNVGIGTPSPKEKLSVNGNIRAKEIKVETANWPDYVFDEDYRVKPLNELESFIREHRHLPGIPDKRKAEAEGVDLGEMNRKLLEKIEELTLHLIEEQKARKQLEAKVRALERSVIEAEEGKGSR